MKIIGEKIIRTDHSVFYRCLANNANPAPTIEWTVNGQSVSSGVNTFIHPLPELSGRRRIDSRDENQSVNGWTVSSDLSLDVIGDESRLFLTCQSGQTMTSKEELEVLVLSKLKCNLLSFLFQKSCL